MKHSRPVGREMPGIVVDVGELTRTCMLSVGNLILGKALLRNRRDTGRQSAGVKDMTGVRM